mgnify:CR=1 FL=1
MPDPVIIENQGSDSQQLPLRLLKQVAFKCRPLACAFGTCYAHH